jgi:sensor histidine kinase YesM
MILHARFEGVHAALIHSPFLTRSLMLDERLAQSSPCIIIITFFITLYRCLFFHKFSSLSRSDHVENNWFHAWRIKLSFHQVFILPQRIPIEWVMPILLRRCNLSSWFQTAHCSMFLSYLLVRVFKFIDLGCVRIGTWWSFWFSTFSSLNMSYQVLKIDENSDVWGLVTVMHGFAIPLGMTSLLLIYV